MKPFIKHTGIVAPLDRANIDTDAIIPKQFLKKIERAGFGKHLFHEWRYLDQDGTKENPEFILNKPAYRTATILLTRENFGCGSSREHAPWALADFGIKAILAPSFADIFYNNALQNGIMLIRLDAKIIDNLFNQEKKLPGLTLSVDLKKQIVIGPDDKQYSFVINPFSRECLLKGLDAIGWTMQFEKKIIAFEKKCEAEKPWLK